MYEIFGVQVFRPVIVVLFIVAAFGGLVVEAIFNHEAGKTYMDKTFRVVFEVLGAQMLIWTMSFVIQRMVPEEYFMLTISVIAQLVVLVAATLVVRSSGFFANFPSSLGRANDAEATNGEQPPRER